MRGVMEAESWAWEFVCSGWVGIEGCEGQLGYGGGAGMLLKKFSGGRQLGVAFRIFRTRM
jgi:hypothetical protein